MGRGWYGVEGFVGVSIGKLLRGSKNPGIVFGQLRGFLEIEKGQGFYPWVFQGQGH